MYGGRSQSPGALADLARSSNDIEFIAQHYSLPQSLIDELRLLLEVRHEIVHPAHRPGVEQDGTPSHLRPLKERGLLQSSGAATDFVWLAQLQSHRLFGWAFEKTAAAVDALLNAHAVPQPVSDGLRASYSDYATGDAG